RLPEDAPFLSAAQEVRITNAQLHLGPGTFSSSGGGRNVDVIVEKPTTAMVESVVLTADGKAWRLESANLHLSPDVRIRDETGATVRVGSMAIAKHDQRVEAQILLRLQVADSLVAILTRALGLPVHSEPGTSIMLTKASVEELSLKF